MEDENPDGRGPYIGMIIKGVEETKKWETHVINFGQHDKTKQYQFRTPEDPNEEWGLAEKVETKHMLDLCKLKFQDSKGTHVEEDRLTCFTTECPRRFRKGKLTQII